MFFSTINYSDVYGGGIWTEPDVLVAGCVMFVYLIHLCTVMTTITCLHKCMIPWNR